MENESSDPHDTQQCPICSGFVAKMPRYPKYICEVCRFRAVDEIGRRVQLFNIDAGGGVQMVFTDFPQMAARIQCGPHWLVCYIDGKKCEAQEGHFGGVFICLAKE